MAEMTVYECPYCTYRISVAAFVLGKFNLCPMCGRHRLQEFREVEGTMTEDSRKHRSETMRCGTCMYFVVKDGFLGRCRRHAPTLDGWPVVFGRDWCGDHRLDIQKVRGGRK